MWRLPEKELPHDYMKNFWEVISQQHHYSCRRKLPANCGRCLFLICFVCSLVISYLLDGRSASSWDLCGWILTFVAPSVFCKMIASELKLALS